MSIQGASGVPVSRKDVRSPLLATHTLQHCSETLISGSELFLAPNSIMPRLWFCRRPSKTGRAGKHQACAPSRRRTLMLCCQSSLIDPRWNSTGAPGSLDCGSSNCNARGVPAKKKFELAVTEKSWFIADGLLQMQCPLAWTNPLKIVWLRNQEHLAVILGHGHCGDQPLHWINVKLAQLDCSRTLFYCTVSTCSNPPGAFFESTVCPKSKLHMFLGSFL